MGAGAARWPPAPMRRSPKATLPVRTAACHWQGQPRLPDPQSHPCENRGAGTVPGSRHSISWRSHSAPAHEPRYPGDGVGWLPLPDLPRHARTWRSHGTRRIMRRVANLRVTLPVCVVGAPRAPHTGRVVRAVRRCRRPRQAEKEAHDVDSTHRKRMAHAGCTGDRRLAYRHRRDNRSTRAAS